MFQSIKTVIRKLRDYDQLVQERDSYRSQLDQLYVPPGHFASPIPCLDEIRKDEDRIFAKMPAEIPGVDMQSDQQLQLLHTLIPFYDTLPFGPEKTEGLRFFFDNPAFPYCDAIVLHCMIRHLKPKSSIEAGSGYSSCVTLDTNELFFGGKIATTFIEPYPELLLSLIKAEDKERIRVVPSRLQDMDLAEFETLQANDILFIDSTHVSKIDSDVNYIFFEILPRLAQGVVVHFHDIPYPFEYRKAWVYEGRAWNEAYLLRAFLQYNDVYRIVLMNSYMVRTQNAFFREHMPLCLKKRGASIWLRKE